MNKIIRWVIPRLKEFLIVSSAYSDISRLIECFSKHGIWGEGAYKKLLLFLTTVTFEGFWKMGHLICFQCAIAIKCNKIIFFWLGHKKLNISRNSSWTNGFLERDTSGF